MSFPASEIFAPAAGGYEFNPSSSANSGGGKLSQSFGSYGSNAGVSNISLGMIALAVLAGLVIIKKVK